jgi:hypothetical protein
MVGWDERRRVVLDNEELYAKVPRVRPVPTQAPVR